jgi:hypothetical protein
MSQTWTYSSRPATRTCKLSWTLSRLHAFSTTQQTDIEFSSVTMALLRNYEMLSRPTLPNFRIYITPPAQKAQLRTTKQAISIMASSTPHRLIRCRSLGCPDCKFVPCLRSTEMSILVLTTPSTDARSLRPPMKHLFREYSHSPLP